jgi:septum formation protein
VQFEVIPSRVEENAASSLTIRELTICNATRKALDIGRRHPRAVVLGADTLVALDGQVIGKPADMADARRILRRLSGRTHQVCTAVFLCCSARRLTNSFTVVSQVEFRSLTSDQIDAYLAKIDSFDKAGAYAAQGHGTDIIRQIHGSYTNVVGLPMSETLDALRSFGIAPRATVRS